MEIRELLFRFPYHEISLTLRSQGGDRPREERFPALFFVVPFIIVREQNANTRGHHDLRHPFHRLFRCRFILMDTHQGSIATREHSLRASPRYTRSSR